MKRYAVRFGPEAEDDLRGIYNHIVQNGSPRAASDFTEQIIDCCERLDLFPFRGAPKDELGSGVRMLAFRRRVTIFYRVKGDAVEIARIFYGGRDYEAAFDP